MKSYTEDASDNVDNEYLGMLYSGDMDKKVKAIRYIKNQIIGMNSKKVAYVNMGVLERVLELMFEDNATAEFAIEGAAVLGSLAQGGNESLQHVLESQAIPILCKGICHSDEKLAMTCLRSLRTCYVTNQVPPDLIYDDVNLVSALVLLLRKNSQTAECVANILLRSCKNIKDQTTLYDAGVVSALAFWLESKHPSVLIPVVGTLSVIVCANEIIANELLHDECFNIVKKLLNLISRDHVEAIQLEASVCLSKILRAASSKSSDEILERKILSVLVRMCHSEKPDYIRIIAANSLAYFIEDSITLQETASISNHLIKNIALYFKVNAEVSKETADKLKESGFKVYASLSANDEKIRKQIVETSTSLITDIHEAINQDCNVPLQAAGMQCLLSLSRSVQQLHTTFQDSKLWEPVISALKSSSSDDVISVSSSVLCNLLLDFSPCKEVLVEYGALEVLLRLIKRNEPPLRVNGVWGLMNLASETNDALKKKIVDYVGITNILGLLGDSHVEVAVKALGALRNILTGGEKEIDALMKIYGQEILDSIRPLVIADNLPEKLREQVLCLLSNIANGSYSKEILMNEDILLTKVISYLNCESEQLQVASIFCITNLMRNTNDRSVLRQHKLRELGAEKQLQDLLNTTSPSLFDRVKVALLQFST